MGFWQRWLAKLAKASQENYGNQRLDCCDLQQKQTAKTAKDSK